MRRVIWRGLTGRAADAAVSKVRFGGLLSGYLLWPCETWVFSGWVKSGMLRLGESSMDIVPAAERGLGKDVHGHGRSGSVFVCANPGRDMHGRAQRSVRSCQWSGWRLACVRHAMTGWVFNVETATVHCLERLDWGWLSM